MADKEYVKVNDSVAHTLRFVFKDKIVGQFYNSNDKMYHLAEYVPYKRPPSAYLCGGVGNFSSSRSDWKRNKCPECWKDFPEP